MGHLAWRVVREELDKCDEMVGQAFQIVQPIGDDALEMEALFIPALTSFYLGNFEKSLDCCVRAFGLYDEEKSKLYSRHTGQNVGVTMQCYWALSLWHLGYPDQARQRIRLAVELARTINHPFSLAYALCHNGWLSHNLRASDDVQRAADEGISIGKEQGFAFWIAEGMLHQGFRLLLDGQCEQALQALGAGLDVFTMTGAKLSLCHFRAMFAQAHLLAGDVDEASRCIEESLQASAENGNTFSLAEIHRLHGEIMRARGNSDEAETCFHKSLDVARSQNARSWQLRTAISLYEHLQDQDRGLEARQSLANIYQCFQEGFETADLQQAKRILSSS